MTIYHLFLECDKHYYGKTKHSHTFDVRGFDHARGNVSWTRTYPPLRTDSGAYKVEWLPRIKFEDSELEAEDLSEFIHTLHGIIKYGWENVRGSVFSSVAIPEYQVSFLRDIVNANYNACYRCNFPGHYTKNCTRKEKNLTLWTPEERRLQYEQYAKELQNVVDKTKECYFSILKMYGPNDHRVTQSKQVLEQAKDDYNNFYYATRFQQS